MTGPESRAPAAAPATPLDSALKLIQSGRPEAAEPLLKALVAAEPRNPDALHLLGLAAHQLGRHEEALGRVTEALAAAERSPLYWNTLGGIQHALGRGQAAIE